MSKQNDSSQSTPPVSKQACSLTEEANMVHINEAAAKLGISTRTIRRMIKQYEEDLRTAHVEEVIQLTVEKLMVSLTDLERIRAPRKVES